MKNLLGLVAAGIVTLASCQNSNEYVIRGTIEGAEDGDMVYLQEFTGTELVAHDSATVADGKFSFTGTPEEVTATRFVTFVNDELELVSQVFLEPGTIKVHMSSQQSSLGGTVCNDAYNEFIQQYMAASTEMNDIYAEAMGGSLTEDEKAEAIALLQEKEAKTMEMVRGSIEKNIGNAVGVQLLASFGMSFPVEEMLPLVEKIPAKFDALPEVMAIKGYFEAAKLSAEGQHFTDFTMNDPDGKELRLSDFISANKYTLVDFWASWCGPCRAEMPNVVAAYAKYKSKGFGIVGVSLDSDVEAWKKALVDLGITWPQMSDLQGWQNAAAQLYGIRSIPATLLISQDGVIVARDLRGDALEEKLAELF